MKKEIYLGLYSDNHNYYSHGDNPLHFSWLCRESVCQILGEIPTMIKITVTDRNPKKKGWHKFCFVRNNYVKFSGYKPSNSYDQDYQGNKYVGFIDRGKPFSNFQNRPLVEKYR